MQHAKTLVVTMMALIALSACTPSYRENLEQKLAGKSPEERRVILAQECGNEIKAGIKKDNPSNVRHFEKMKEICEEMTGKQVTIRDARK